MKNTERQNKIIELLQSKSMSVVQIADAIGVSEMTIRRDVAYLKKMGFVTQFRGGVAIRSSRSFRSFETRADIDRDEKILLAQKAVKYIKDGMLIYIDNSSTCYYLSCQLENFRNIMVVTNSSKVTDVLGSFGVRVKMASGNYLYRDRCVCGSETEEYIRNYRYDIAFLSSSCFDNERVTSWSESQSNVRRAVIESAARTCFLMTASKYNRSSKFVVCRTEDVEIITVDPKLESKFK